MANLGCPWLSHPCRLNLPTISSTSSILFLLLSSPYNNHHHHLCFSSRLKSKATTCSKENSSNSTSADKSDSRVLDDEELLKRVATTANDADQALEMVGERCGRDGGTVSASDCCSLITAALHCNNVHLALSVYSAMRNSTFRQGESGLFVDKWKWARPDFHIYASLVQGLASSLRVSSAIMIINDVCRVGVSSAEVPFGNVVRCPSCMIAVAVAQPQHGIQIASCSRCRYQYELVSGNIVSVESEEIRSSLSASPQDLHASASLSSDVSLSARYLISPQNQQGSPPTKRSMDIPSWERGLRFLQVMKQSLPAAVHSIVVQTPIGVARTYRFATKSVEIPARQGERVTISLAAPSNVYREVGPFRFNSKAPGFNSGEPMCLTNHSDGRESPLLRAPGKNESLSLRNPSILFPLLTLLATGDAASGIIDPSLPQFISISVVASFAFGTTLNTVVLPQLNRLPQRMVDTLAMKQKLLSQYDFLQNRVKDLREAAEKEVWTLARMCQLENKILAVGEPSYRARRSRIITVRESLKSSLARRIELIDNYAKISSMIEIEVEMDSDVPAAEATSSAESIAEQIEQIMEFENLEERWKTQAEANDEVERLLRSEPVPTEQVLDI